MHGKALVTGGAGFIGSHLAKALLARGLQVTILDDLSMGREENIPAGAEFIKGDICSAKDVMPAIKDATIVFHEAARVSIRSSLQGFYDDARVNLMGTLNLLQCCENSDVRKFIFASSMAVYADHATPDPIPESHVTEPISPYGIAKLAAEKYCMQFSQNTGIDCLALRYFNTYGPGQTFTPYVGVITIFIRRLLENRQPLIFGDGEQKRDFVHVSDIVKANVLAMETDIKRGIFNVGTGKATSVNEIAKFLCDRINPGLRPDHIAAHPGELRYSIADIKKISETMGYQPAAIFAEKLDELVEIYRSQGV